MKKVSNKITIYQAKNGAIELRQDFNREDVVWANLNQIAQLYGRDKSVISRHIRNIFQSGELDEKAVVVKIATTTKHGAIKGKTQTKMVNYYNLDVILSVGYRVDSKTAIAFRKWATKTLKKHILKGYTINKKVLAINYQEFLKTVDYIKLLAEKNENVSKNDILDLIKTFSSTWFSLERYDKQKLPKKGKIKSRKLNLENLSQDLYKKITLLKKELIKKKQATQLFATEVVKDGLKGILGNVFQTISGKDVYTTIEDKASHLLYFIIKDHPFIDGNKRTSAFSFIWFLQKMNFSFKQKITPETLTTLTLLIAKSKTSDKDQMIGLILLLLQN